MFYCKKADFKLCRPNRRLKTGKVLIQASVLFAVCLIFNVVQGQAQVVFSNATSEGVFDTLGVTALSVPHTVGTGANRALYVGISTSTTTPPVGAPTERVSSVTFESESMPGTLIPLTQVGTQVSQDFKNTIDLFRLVAPPSGNGTVRVNFVVVAGSPAANLLVNYAVVGVTSYTGVSQAIPNGAFVSGAGMSATPAVVVPDEIDGDLVLDVLGVSPNAGFVLEGANQTRRYAIPSEFSSFDVGAGSTEPGNTAAPVTMSWTLSNSDSWALGATAIKQFVSTAATVTIGGRVLSAAGRGIARARVSMIDSNGETRTVLTNSFGHFRFQNVAAGENYIFTAAAKRYKFTAQLLNVNEEKGELNFTAAP